MENNKKGELSCAQNGIGTNYYNKKISSSQIMKKYYVCQVVRI